MKLSSLIYRPQEPRSVFTKLVQIDWVLPLLTVAIAAIGVVALYSTAGGRVEPWASRHAVRAAAGVVMMVVVGMVPMRVWMRLANPGYALVLIMLVAVPFVGVTQLGARRWLGAGEASLQPAELMKVTLVLVLARYYQWLPAMRKSHPLGVALPLAMIAVPAALVLRQPDLGTAILIAATGLAVVFLAGVRLIYFIAGGIAAGGSAQLIWPYLKDYQQRRLLTFLDPDRDPLGAGYHIAQSKIALGSGGLQGRGFLGGTQSQLNFLPEKHTDFIFTMFAEESGFIGAIVLLGLYALLIGALFVIALRARTIFARLLAAGIGAVVALHVSVNVAMVMGLMPVVGVPLPLVSYGGTSMLTLMFGLGLVLSATMHRDERLRTDEFGALW